MKIHYSLLFVLSAFFAGNSFAEQQPVTINIKRMSLDTALAAAQASIAACRKAGVQITVTVVDRGGHTQVVLRDVLAMDISIPASRDKAYTAMSFNASTNSLKGVFEGPYNVPKIRGLLVSRGGLPVTAAGSIIGGIGVSGSSGEIDEKCAQAGLDAIMDDLEMSAE